MFISLRRCFLGGQRGIGDLSDYRSCRLREARAHRNPRDPFGRLPYLRHQ